MSHVTEQTTCAALGGGSIVVGSQTLTEDNVAALGLADLNRDINAAQKITKDQGAGGYRSSR